MPIVRIPAHEGGLLALHDMGGPPGAPGFLWNHANGFASGSYGTFIRELSASVRVFALDLRGHGESFQPAGPLEACLTMPALTADLAAAIGHARSVAPGLPLFAGGHSVGALPVLHALLANDCRLDGGVLVDAAVFPPEGHAIRAEAQDLTRDRESRIPRRREVFANRDELAQALSAVPAFAPLSPEAMAAHCGAVLQRDAADAWRLRCRPAVEGFLYGLVANASPYNELGRIAVPVLVVGADPSHPGSTWVTRMQAEIASRIPGARGTSVPGTGHLLPLQAPGECARRVTGWIQEIQ